MLMVNQCKSPLININHIKSPLDHHFSMVNPPTYNVWNGHAKPPETFPEEKFYNGWAILCIVVLVTGGGELGKLGVWLGVD